jgi:hypothetical protein
MLRADAVNRTPGIAASLRQLHSPDSVLPTDKPFTVADVLDDIGGDTD